MPTARRPISQAVLGTLATVLLCTTLFACGRATGRETMEGFLLAGDTDVWLVDTTPVAIGGATIVAEATGAPIAPGQPIPPGSKLRVEGRRTEAGVWAAERIAVGPVDPARLAATLPAGAVQGRVETIDRAGGQWQVAGRTVRVPAGTPGAADVAPNEQVAVRGYELPGGDLLAAGVTRAQPAPAPPPIPASTPTPTPRPVSRPTPEPTAVAPTPTPAATATTPAPATTPTPPSTATPVPTAVPTATTAPTATTPPTATPARAPAPPPAATATPRPPARFGPTPTATPSRLVPPPNPAKPPEPTKEKDNRDDRAKPDRNDGDKPNDD